MPKRILVLDGHPDASGEHFCGALADAYANAATAAGHEVRRVKLGDLDTPFLTVPGDFESPPPEALRQIQTDIVWCEHLVVIFPLWLGTVPAKLKALLEQLFRGGFGFNINGQGWAGKMKGRGARLIVTMGMPGPIFTLVFGAHGVKALERGVFWLSGFSPIRRTIVGGVEAIGSRGRAQWLARVRALGAAAR